MVAKILLVAISCVFIAQIHNVQCHVRVPVAPETQSQTEFEHATAAATINAILRHLRIVMTHPVSAPLVQYIATSARVLLTDATGQRNVQHFIDLIVNLLLDENTLVSMQTFHRRLVQLAAAGRGAPIVLETVAMSAKRILDEPQLLEATNGFVDGINIMLDGMNETKLRAGINRVKSMTRLASFFKPIVGIKIPTLQKLKRSSSDVSVGYGSADGEALQSRDLSWINGPAMSPQSSDLGWINGPALTMQTADNVDSVNTDI